MSYILTLQGRKYEVVVATDVWENLDINKYSNPNEARATQRDWCFYSGHSFASGSISMDAMYSSVWFCLQRQMYSSFFIIFWAYFFPLSLELEGW